jgi:cytochrome b561
VPFIPHPQLPGSLAQWERASAALSHWLLYLIMIGMPLSGYLFSACGGHAVTYFGLFTLPGLAKNDTLQHVAFWAHVAIGQWLTYALVLLHIGATGWHVAVRRDGVPFRMLPEQNGWASLIRPRWGRIHAASEPEPTSRHPVSLIATKDRGSPTDPPP